MKFSGYLSLPVLKVVIIEPDATSRKIYCLLFRELSRKMGASVRIFTSDTGVEGLGYIVITKPDIVVMNIRLQDYSGEELVDHLNENLLTYQGISTMQIMVLYEFKDEKVILRLNNNFTAININSRYFVKNFFHFLIVNMKYRFRDDLDEQSRVIRKSGKSVHSAVLYHCASRALFYATHANCLRQKAATEILFYRFVLNSWVLLRKVLALMYVLGLRCVALDFARESDSIRPVLNSRS